jgi:hypothetical protein
MSSGDAISSVFRDEYDHIFRELCMTVTTISKEHSFPVDPVKTMLTLLARIGMATDGDYEFPDEISYSELFEGILFDWSDCDLIVIFKKKIFMVALENDIFSHPIQLYSHSHVADDIFDEIKNCIRTESDAEGEDDDESEEEDEDEFKDFIDDSEI